MLTGGLVGQSGRVAADRYIVLPRVKAEIARIFQNYWEGKCRFDLAQKFDVFEHGGIAPGWVLKQMCRQLHYLAHDIVQGFRQSFN